MKKFLIVLIILASLILQGNAPVNVKTENFSSFFTKFKSELVHKSGDDFNIIYHYTPQFILKVYGHLEFMQNFAGREILHGHGVLCFFKKYYSYVNQLLPITNPSVKFKGERNEFELSIYVTIIKSLLFIFLKTNPCNVQLFYN